MTQKLDVGTATLALAASITDRAAELISDGWVKGSLYKKVEGAPQGFCILGALYLAAEEVFGELHGGAYSSQNDALQVAQMFITDEAYNFTKPGQDGSIPGFNDSSARTEDEVIGALKRASSRLWSLSVDTEDLGFSWEPSQWATTDEGQAQAKQYLHAVLA